MENTEEKKAPMGKIPVSSEKLKALQAAMDKIEKNYGKGAIMKMGDDHIDEIAVIPTGSIGLNAALGDIDILDCVVDRRPFAHNAIDIIDNFLGDVESDIIFAQVFICEQGSPAACEQFQHGISGIRKRLSSWGTKLP
mgnify:CR=1 FL=1